MDSNYIAEKPLGYTKYTSIDAATGLVIPEGTSLILIVPETQAIRWRDDGTAPTTTVGQPLAVGAELRYTSRSPARLSIIGQVAGGAINVTCYGQGNT